MAQETYSKQRDIVLLTLGFLGTVTGYYLGRVPAEKQADIARDAAAKVKESENRLKQQVRAGLDSIQQQRTAAVGEQRRLDYSRDKSTSRRSSMMIATAFNAISHASSNFLTTGRAKARCRGETQQLSSTYCGGQPARCSRTGPRVQRPTVDETSQQRTTTNCSAMLP